MADGCPLIQRFVIISFINFLRKEKIRVWCRYLLLGETEESYLPRTIPVPCCSKLGYHTLITALCRQTKLCTLCTACNAIKGALTIITERRVATGGADLDPYVFGPPRSGSGSVSQNSEVRNRIRILLSSSKNSKKNLDSYCSVTVLWLLFVFLSLKNDVNVPSKSIKRKNFKNKISFLLAS
jgi:hypothetical protein